MFTMNNINKLYEMSDLAIVRLIGNEIKRLRLEENLTQEQLSVRAGVGRSFISQVENGRPSSILTLLQILRALKRLNLLEGFASEPVISPMLVARMEKEKRFRATRRKSNSTPKKSSW